MGLVVYSTIGCVFHLYVETGSFVSQLSLLGLSGV
jgi:hypothetical protein